MILCYSNFPLKEILYNTKHRRNVEEIRIKLCDTKKSLFCRIKKKFVINKYSKSGFGLLKSINILLY